MIASVPTTSKLPSKRSKNEFYRYYAGYPLTFAEWALRELKLPSGALVIDPWNGSGTTTAACASLKVSCQGYDINPVMVHLGRARVASDAHFDEAEELINALSSVFFKAKFIDIESIGVAFRDFPISSESAHSVAIAAMFPYARALLKEKKTKNPSWFKAGASFENLPLNRESVFSSWKMHLQEIFRWRSANDYDGVAITIERGDSRKSLGRRDAFDGILTSPPYLTRLDYVQATLPEFLLLREFDVAPDVQKLRRSMLGSPLTSDRPAHSLNRLPNNIKELLGRIEAHPSKASSSYYHRFFSTYFIDLHASMRNIAKVLKNGAMGCMVVQSSNYKEIEVDLACAVVSLGEEFGLRHCTTVEFGSHRSMSLVNSRAHEKARKPKSEFAVFLRKE